MNVGVSLTLNEPGTTWSFVLDCSSKFAFSVSFSSVTDNYKYVMLK